MNNSWLSLCRIWSCRNSKGSSAYVREITKRVVCVCVRGQVAKKIGKIAPKHRANNYPHIIKMHPSGSDKGLRVLPLRQGLCYAKTYLSHIP